jgi:hypothetical protein
MPRSAASLDVASTVFPSALLEAGFDDWKCAARPDKNASKLKYTLQVVQVSWGSPMQGSENCSLSSSSRMSSSLCSYPLTFATQDEEACASDADPLWSSEATLSSIEAPSGTASTGMQVACCQQEQQQLHRVHVPTLRFLLDPSLVSVGAKEYVGHVPHSWFSHAQRPRQNQALCVLSSNTGLLPRRSARLLKFYAQSPRSDIAALYSAAADRDIQCIRKLVARGVPHTPCFPPPNPSQMAVTSFDIDSAASSLMLASRGATPGHVECLLSTGTLADWALAIDGETVRCSQELLPYNYANAAIGGSRSQSVLCIRLHSTSGCKSSIWCAA